jgi:hypothetical protein
MTSTMAPVRSRLAEFVTRSLPARRVGAAVCLPAALASLLAGVLPAPGMAASRLDVRDQIQRASGTPPVVLTLMNGQTISGSFHGFVGDWSDSMHTALRYAAWRENQPDSLPRFGDAMVVALTSGDTLRGTFEGVGATFLALDMGNPRFLQPVAYETIRTTGPGAGAPIGGWSLLRRYLQEAPLVNGVLLRQGAMDMLVTREAISSVRETAHAGDNGSNVMIFVVIGIIAGALICAAAVESAANDASNSLTTCTPTTARALHGPDAGFGASTVSGGLAPLRPGEARRP